MSQIMVSLLNLKLKMKFKLSYRLLGGLLPNEVPLEQWLISSPFKMALIQSMRS